MLEDIKEDIKDFWYKIDEDRYYKYGQLKRQICYLHDKLDGLCTCFHENGLFEIKFNMINGVRSGLYEEWYETGCKKIKNNYIDGLKHGLCESWNYNYSLHYYYKNDLKYGLCVEYENNIQKCNYNYINDLKHGLCEDFYQNGSIKSSCDYINGLKHGLFREYFSNKILKIKGQYVNNLKYGMWSERNKENESFSTEYYFNDNSIDLKELLLKKDL